MKAATQTIVDSVKNLIKTIDSFLNQPFFLILKIFSALICFTLAIGIIVALVKKGVFRFMAKKIVWFFQGEKHNERKIFSKWKKIESLARTRKPEKIKEALLKADRLAIEALNEIGLAAGKTLKEKIENRGQIKLDLIEEILAADQSLAKPLRLTQALETLSVYKNFFKNNNIF